MSGTRGTRPALARALTRAPRVAVLVAWVLWQAVVATCALAAATLRRPPFAPCLVRLPLRCTTDLERAVLAWAITVTPGTLTVAIGAEEMYVHQVLGAPRDEALAGLREVEDRVLWALRGGLTRADPELGKDPS